jgi:type III secretion protein C
MPFYKALIERFDVPTKAVEIQVAIVEVDVGHSRAMGLDVLRFLNGGRDFTWRPAGGDAGFDSDGANFFGALTGVLRDYNVSARLQAMEDNHTAKTLSRPSVLTLDNIAAVISQSEQTYVPVAGAYASDLFAISASIALRVIPHIIELESEDGGMERHIKLFVNIDDGSMDVSGAQPRVSTSQISTQTVLTEGQSLVVGGYYKERHSNGKRGIPFLTKIPIVGRLFAVDDKNVATTERLFIISPRIIEINAENGDPYEQFFKQTRLTGKPTMTMRSFRARRRGRHRSQRRARTEMGQPTGGSGNSIAIPSQIFADGKE